MQPKKTKFLILGAGPTGLGAAYRLRELGEEDFLVIERDPKVGGLARSFQDENGFTWDIGGHVQFSHYEYFDAAMDRTLAPTQWIHHERESWIWMQDRFIPYPLQNNIRHLPKEMIWKCIEGLVDLTMTQTTVKPTSSHFLDWIHHIFGAGFAEVFLEPYNFKVWATPLERMSFDWIGERVSVIDLRRILKNIILAQDDKSWGPNATFRFPKIGGSGAVWEGVAKTVGEASIWLETEVTRVNITEKILTCQNGTSIRYEHCLSTLPINELIARTNLENPVKQYSNQLVFSTTNVIGVGLQGTIPESLKGKCWLYFPENSCPFYRATIFSHYSRYNVPNPLRQWSIMAEVSESPYKPVKHETIIQDTINGLKATRLIGQDTPIVSQWYHRVRYGYPVPTLGRDEILNALHSELEPNGISSRGRFGGWKYEASNQDHSFMQGVEWVDRVLFETPEETYFYPNKINGTRKQPIRRIVKSSLDVSTMR